MNDQFKKELQKVIDEAWNDPPDIINPQNYQKSSDDDGYYGWGIMEVDDEKSEKLENEPKCTCGADSIYGEGSQFHSEWCDLVKCK